MSSSNKSSGRKRRWDIPTPETSSDEGKLQKSEWEKNSSDVVTSSRWDNTPNQSIPDTPSRSRWDETPIGVAVYDTPKARNFPFQANDSDYSQLSNQDILRNRFMTDEEINMLLPKEGYINLTPPEGYKKENSSREKNEFAEEYSSFSISKSIAVPSNQIDSFRPPENDLPEFPQSDYQYFGQLMNIPDHDCMNFEELQSRKILKLLLKIKKGTPQMRRHSQRIIIQKAKEFGAAPLFDHILPILMSPNLDIQERHIFTKLVDRILFQLGAAVRPYVHKILVVIEPLLIDEDYFIRIEGREIISNLSKAAGAATMISTLRPDIDHNEEYVRNNISRTFAVVASALGITSILPFLQAVCRTKKSWQARHTGLKIIQQISILQGASILPHTSSLINCLSSAFSDENIKIRTVAALAISSLAESSFPYGIESFETVLEPIWKEIKNLRGKALAAHLKAIGSLMALMNCDQANYYIQGIHSIILREFRSSENDVKCVVLGVLRQILSVDGIDISFLQREIIPDFFKYFWVRKNSLDARLSRNVVETTVKICTVIKNCNMLSRISVFLKDESSSFRRMACDAVYQILKKNHSYSIFEIQSSIVDGIIFSFQEQINDDIGNIVINTFAIILERLCSSAKEYLIPISSMILWRLSNKSSKIRQLSANLIGKISHVFSICGEDQLLSKIVSVLYENLGEEYPDVLGGILGALKSSINVIGIYKMNPSCKDLLPKLTPILRNRHEIVQENCIELIGVICERAAESISSREWMRICFELLDLLKANRKSVRKCAMKTFGYISKAIGPHDVLAALLSNLKVQERQNRVCTTIAIAIVAKSCSPFTVLPALMNEYRIPEMNVQNGVLKSISHIFEFIGEMGKDYVFSVTDLLNDALTDRDQVHRQTASTAIKHICLGIVGHGNEEAIIHLMNSILPNVFDANTHLIIAVIEAVDAFPLVIGSSDTFQYLVQGLFHPARRVRDIYWKMYNNLYLSSADSLVSSFNALLNLDIDVKEKENYLNIFI